MCELTKSSNYRKSAVYHSIIGTIHQVLYQALVFTKQLIAVQMHTHASKKAGKDVSFTTIFSFMVILLGVTIIYCQARNFPML